MKKENKKYSIPAIRTFKTDTSDYIKKKGVSMVDIMMANRKKKKFWNSKDGELFSKKTAIVAISVLLLSGGVLLIALIYKKDGTPDFRAKSVPKAIITSDNNKDVFIKDSLDISETEVSDGKFLRLIPFAGGKGSKREITEVGDFFANAGIGAPRSLIDSLDGKFMIGVFQSFAGGKYPVLILKTKFYEHAFASMMDWEKNIFDNLKIFFGEEGVSPDPNGFTDKEIKNTDTRILYDINRNPVLIYAFFSRKYLIITTSEPALKEILRRLSSVRYLNE